MHCSQDPNEGSAHLLFKYVQQGGCGLVLRWRNKVHESCSFYAIRFYYKPFFRLSLAKIVAEQQKRTAAVAAIHRETIRTGLNEG